MNLYRDETAPYAAVCGYERNSRFRRKADACNRCSSYPALGNAPFSGCGTEAGEYLSEPRAPVF